jgi:hypothetical protein
MNEFWFGIAVVDHVSGGRVVQALYDRAGDEPRRPIRRRIAAALRWLAARLAPLPAAPAATPAPQAEVATQP